MYMCHPKHLSDNSYSRRESPRLPNGSFSRVSVPAALLSSIKSSSTKKRFTGQHAMRAVSGLKAQMITAVLFAGLVLIGVSAADAQVSYARYAAPTHRQARRVPMRRTVALPRTAVRHLSQATLPKTTLDSFVLNAGAQAELIYGDEGFHLPPFDEYTKAHRINSGITGVRDAGITTGHGSLLPDATGGDEFVDGPEFTYSGSNYGNPRHQTPYDYTPPDPNYDLYERSFRTGSDYWSRNFKK